MIVYIRRATRRNFALALCLVSLIGDIACCEGSNIKRWVEQCGEGSYVDCCLSPGFLCLTGDPCDSADCSDRILPCTDPFIKSFEPDCIEEQHDDIDLKIKGTNLADVTRVIFLDSYLRAVSGSVHATESEVTLKVDTFSLDPDQGDVLVQVSSSDGKKSNNRLLRVRSCSPASSSAAAPFAVMEKSPTVRAQSLPPGSLVFTPVCDGTVQQLDASVGRAGSTIMTA